MEIRHATRDGCVVVALHGRIDPSTVARFRRVLLKDLSEQPFALICDLSGVDALDPVCATVFAAVANHPASRWPGTSFLLCAARPAVARVLTGLQVPRFLQLHASVEEAVDAAVARPPYLRDELTLPPEPGAAALARAFVRDTCTYWRLALPDEATVDWAVSLVNELVTNAVRHAGTPLRLQVELLGDCLYLSVRDGDPRMLRAVPADPDAEGGRGLLLVARLADSWGAHRHLDGKVVWCRLKL